MLSESCSSKRLIIITSVVLLWALYTTFVLVLQSNQNYRIQVGLFATFFEVFIDIVVVFFAGLIWQEAKDGLVKNIFMLLTFAFIFDAISNLFYNYDIHVLQLSYVNTSFLVSSLYNAPYLITLILEFSLFSLLFNHLYKTHPQVKIKTKLLSWIPVYIFLITLIVSVFFKCKILQVQLQQAPHLLYDFAQFIFYVANIVLILLCSSLIKNKNVFLIICGYIISFCSSVAIYFDFVFMPLGTRNILELGWVLGSLLIAYGVYDYYKNLDFISQDNLL